MSKPINVTESFSIHPTGATNTSNMSASSSYPSSNAMTDSNSNTYARYSLSRNTAGYTHYTFTLPDIPSAATITSLTATVKVYINNLSYVSNTICQFYTNTTAKGSNYTFANTSSSNVVNMTDTGTWTVSELQNLRLRIGGTGANVNNSKYITVYGATVTISYQLQGIAYTIDASSSVDGVTVSPSTQDIIQEGSGTVTIDADDDSEFYITDNGIDILDQLVSVESSATVTYTPSSYANLTNASINSSYPITNGYHNADQNSQYARIDINSNSTGYINLLFDVSEIPENATITSVSVRARLRVSATNRITSSTCQLYTGSTAKGSGASFQNTTSGGAIVTPSAGSWTRSELDNLRLRITATRSSSGNSGYVYIYGADITVVYEVAGKHYTYTISDIDEDHVILIYNQSLYIKSNGTWIPITKIYHKENGTWVEKNLSYLSDNNIDYLKQGSYTPTEIWETLWDANTGYYYENNGDYPYCWIQDLGSTPITVGSTWRITYNNTQYRCTAALCSSNNTIYIGNPKYDMQTDNNENVPFCFYCYREQAWTGALDIPNQNTTVSLKIECLVSA